MTSDQKIRFGIPAILIGSTMIIGLICGYVAGVWIGYLWMPHFRFAGHEGYLATGIAGLLIGTIAGIVGGIILCWYFLWSQS